MQTCFGWHVRAEDAVGVPQEGCRVSCPGRSGRRHCQLDACRAALRDLSGRWGRDMQVLHLIAGSALQAVSELPLGLVSHDMHSY